MLAPDASLTESEMQTVRLTHKATVRRMLLALAPSGLLKKNDFRLGRDNRCAIQPLTAPLYPSVPKAPAGFVTQQQGPHSGSDKYHS